MPDLPPPALGDRSLFPTLEARAYLNHAAIAPPSAPVLRTVETFMAEHAARGAGAFARWHAQREVLRQNLARLIGAQPCDVGLVPNTSAGVMHVALCFPWRPDDGVLLFEGEFPANVSPWQRAADVFGLNVRFESLEPYERSHAEGLEALDRALSSHPRTRMVAVSAVQFRTGLRMPLRAMAEVCHRHGAELFVDAIQACGGVPVDVADGPIDYLAAGGHKWLMGPMGAGFVYIHPERMRALRPVTAGWASHEDAFDFLLRGEGHLRYDRPIRQRADFVEGGSPNGLGYAALGAAVELLLALGVDAIFTHVTEYLDALEQGLRARGFISLRAREAEARSTILSVRSPEGVDALALQQALGRHGVITGLPDGILRFSPHWPNALDEVPAVLDAVNAALAAPLSDEDAP
jgi:cysteine desulfurase / selenocysteine lyase